MAKTGFVPTATKIKAIGVGGGGCNALNRMVRADIQGVEFIAVNTDVQVLTGSEAPTRVQIGEKCSRGLGAGGDPKRGREAAEESIEELRNITSGADMVFIAAGMGGGTGTGASPLIARMAREGGALTVAIVTKPFHFEMARRMQIAEEGINELEAEVDALIVVPNEQLLRITGDKVTVDTAFKAADDILMNGVRAISEVITVPGLINLDFADVKAILKGAGPCWLSIGHGTGQNRVVEAAQAAISTELLDMAIHGARGILYVVAAAPNLTLAEVGKVADVVAASVDEEAMVIFGVTLDSRIRDEVRITLVATGFESAKTVAKAKQDEEFSNLIKELEADESRLEAPAYLRRPVSMRRMARSPSAGR